MLSKNALVGGRLCLQRKSQLLTPVANLHYVRSDGWWQHEHQPKNHPEHEHRAHEDPVRMRHEAAAKYGLLPSDYRPYPFNPERSNLAATGDYPDLGHMTFAHKDPHENYSNIPLRRNYGEPVQFDWDRFRPDRITYTGLETDNMDVKKPYFVPLFFGFYISVALIFYWFAVGNKYTGYYYVQPLMPKQYHWDFKRTYPYNDPRKYPITNYEFVAPAKAHHDEEGGHH